MQVGKL